MGLKERIRSSAWAGSLIKDKIAGLDLKLSYTAKTKQDTKHKTKPNKNL